MSQADQQFDPNAVCERCGCFGAYRWDGAVLCADCYETRGSCCPEFGADDGWAANERPETSPNGHLKDDKRLKR